MNFKSKFGFGCMRLPTTDENDPSSIDQDLFNKMVDIYMEKGYNYFDTSYAYHNGKSEVAIRKALVERYPRETFKICDKMPTWALTNSEDNEKFVNEMLERLGIDYFDVFFIHNINGPWLKNAKNAANSPAIITATIIPSTVPNPPKDLENTSGKEKRIAASKY